MCASLQLTPNSSPSITLKGFPSIIHKGKVNSIAQIESNIWSVGEAAGTSSGADALSTYVAQVANGYYGR